MVKLNNHYQKLHGDYLFPQVQARVEALKAKVPNASLISLGVGDVTRPLPPSIVSALTTAAQEMGDPKTFRGYGPSAGYPFLREAIAAGDYAGLGVSAEEIFVSDGAKSDLANIQEIFSVDNKVAVPDPTYPVYLDTNVMAGRTRLRLKTGRYGGIVYLPCTEENGFQPRPPNVPVDLVYLCSPNNPTGVAMEKGLLQEWVAYAKRHNAILLFDGAYEAYITSGAPRSIYEIDGAKEVAIEFRSFSKTAGFSGLRCAYAVIPRQLAVSDMGQTLFLHALWKRRSDTKFNGVAYPVQKAAAAIYAPQGKKETGEIVRSYSERARFLREGLASLGYTVYGGVDAPYVWCKTPPGMDSWEFFDRLLEKAHLIAIPGQGFGLLGDRFLRLSAFAELPALTEALLRLKSL